MEKLFSNSKYDSSLFPRAGLIVVFEHETQLKAYLMNFFSNYFNGPIDSFIEELINIGIITQTIKIDILNRPKEVGFTFDCHRLLYKLSLISKAEIKDDLQLYTVQEAANYLSVTRQTIYNIIKSGNLVTVQLEGVKGQRIRRSDLQKYLSLR